MFTRLQNKVVTASLVLLVALFVLTPQPREANLQAAATEDSGEISGDTDRTVGVLLYGTDKETEKKIREVIQRPGQYEPRVFRSLAHVLFAKGRKDEGAFWFYAAQLRTSYDANRSTHPLAYVEVEELIHLFGLPIDEWAFENPRRVKELIQRVVEWDRKTPHLYDASWINHYARFESVLRGHEIDEREPAEMLVPTDQWEQVAERTRQEFTELFDNALAQQMTAFEIARTSEKGLNVDRFRNRQLRQFTDPKLRDLADAAESGQLDRVDQLVAEGVDVNGRGKDGSTPLIFILDCHWTTLPRSTRGMARLLELHADPNLQSEAGDSALSLAASNPLGAPSVRMLLAYGADANLASLTDNSTPLFNAIEGCNREIVQALLRAGASPSWQESICGRTPLTSAAFFRRFDIVYLLLNAGADFKVRTDSGLTLVEEILDFRLDPESEQAMWRQRCIDLLRRSGVDFREELKRIETEQGVRLRGDVADEIRALTQ